MRTTTQKSDAQSGCHGNTGCLTTDPLNRSQAKVTPLTL